MPPEVHFIQKTFPEYPPYQPLSHRHAEVRWYPQPLTSPRCTAVILSLPCLSQPDFSRKHCLCLLSPFSNLPLVFQPHFSIAVADWSLWTSQKLGSGIRCLTFQEQSHPHSLATHPICSDPRDYLKGSLFGSFLDISADTYYCGLDSVLEEEEGLTEKPSLPLRSVWSG